MEVVFDNIVKKYGDVTAVGGVTLRIADGALHFLLGPSGCGKTTVLRMLAGLETPTGGRILFNGRDVTNLPAAARGIGMVFQNYALWPHMTVRKNIEYGLSVQKMPTADLRKRAQEALEITQLSQYGERLPGQLSGGQQQRVALARALAVRPSVLLLDEPLSNLDAQLRLEMRDNLSRIHKQLGITTVYVTHDQKEALSMGTSVSVLRAGRLIQSDPPRQLYHSPKTPFVARFVGETNLVEGECVSTESGKHTMKTAFGLLTASRTMTVLRTGQKYMVSIRPEAVKLQLSGASPSPANPLNLKLEHLTYLGESEQFQLLSADGSELRASIFNPPDHKLATGDTITGWVAPEDVLVLPVETDHSAST
ncbi:MAG: ABC transporter ATP-binding protein [Proteobacteria bacterium]|nr:ABC transporter ATP-binding protein [Pseudomonadota bacterium]